MCIYIYQKAAAAIWEWHPSRENIVRNFVFLSTSISTPRPKKTNLILSKPKRLRRQSRHEGDRPSAIMQAQNVPKCDPHAPRSNALPTQAAISNLPMIV